MNIDYNKFIGSLSRGLGSEFVNYAIVDGGIDLFMRLNLPKELRAIIAPFVQSYFVEFYDVKPRVGGRKNVITVRLPREDPHSHHTQE